MGSANNQHIKTMQTITAHANQIAQDLILDSGEVQIQLCSPAGGYVLAVSAERSYIEDNETGECITEKVEVKDALDELIYFFNKDNCYQPDGSVAAEIDGEWYTIIYKVEGGYAGIQIK
jgi:hypothetical protein